MSLEPLGLRERPFSSSPDPRFVYLGEHHQRALAHLLRSVQAQGGIAHLSGESGMGKTTMCRMLLNRLPERVDVALILNAVLTPEELLDVVFDELGVARGAEAPTPTGLADVLSRRQAARPGERRTVVIVDDAHSLGLDVLEHLSQLSSLERDGKKLLQVILIGEPGLIELLSRGAPDGSAAPATGYFLMSFTENETCAYVRHRIAIAGGGRDIFDVDALRDVHRLSAGVPRLINTICARALLIAVAQRRQSVDLSTVRAAARAALAPAGSPSIESPEEAPPIEPVTILQEAVASPAAGARRPLWPWLVSGGLLLNAGAIAAAFLGPRPADVVAPPPAQRAEAETPAEVQPSTAPAVPPVDDPPRSPQLPDAAETPAQPPALATRSDAPTPVRPMTPAVTGDPSASASTSESTRQRRRRERAETWSAPALKPPPSSPRPASSQELELKIDMLVWAAEPDQRMVYVNGQKYTEGQTLENGAVLERIEQDAIVMIQEGQRLRLRPEAR
jgi:type II secretory pathway predicted ATPase ExeA